MSWNRSFSSSGGGIRKICREKILNLLISLKVKHQWNILILDSMALNLISTCFKTEEILSHNIAVILNLEGEREDLGYLSSIYLLGPTEESVNHLLKDFEHRSKYGNAHLIFLSTIPDEIFQTLIHGLKTKWVETLVEIDLMFLPHESQVYSLNDPSFFSTFFDAYNDVKIKEYEIVAKKLGTLFSTLEKMPLIRYRRGFAKNLIFAQIVEKELCYQKNSSRGSLYKKDASCTLLIIDRAFDCVTPVLHDFTFQALAYDLLDIEDDLYFYQLGVDRSEMDTQFVPLTEDDSLWRLLRHEHIAKVSRLVQNMVQNDELMTVAKKIGSRHRGLPPLSDSLRAHLLYKQNESFYGFRHMANTCMKKYCEGINVLSQLEQDLALGKDSEKRLIKNPEPQVIGVVTNKDNSIVEKLRIILLYVFFKRGLSKFDLDYLLSKAEIPESSRGTISNLLHMDMDLLRPGFCDPFDSSLKQDYMDSDEDPHNSRWTPLVKSLILSCVEDRLSEDLYPFLNTGQGGKLKPKKKSEQWTLDEHVGSSKRQLVIFIEGGVSYTEMRCVYEVMKNHPNWEIYIGGDSLITPNKFFDKLQELRNFFHPK